MPLPPLRLLYVTLLILLCPSAVLALPPQISPVPDQRTRQGQLYEFQANLLQGDEVRWFKEYGPDELSVDALSGTVRWQVPANLPGESFYVGVMAANGEGQAFETWIVTVGQGQVIYCGPSETHRTIAAASAASRSGDTIIVRDSITPFVDPANHIYNDGGGQGSWPTNGTPRAYTTIMAENPGGVTLDGANSRRPIYGKGSYVSFDGSPGTAYTLEYVAVKGFVAGRSVTSGPITLVHTNHIKLMHCGAFDQAADSGSAINLARCGYTLIESCYIYGHFREAIMHWLSEYTIMRRNIARRDGNASREPLGGYVHYASRDSHLQSSIIIDFDRTDYIVDQTYMAGAFEADCGSSCADTGRQIRNLSSHSCLSLNSDDRIAALSQPTSLAEYTTPVWQNMVVWDQRMWWNGPPGGNRYPGSAIRSKGDSIWRNCTFAELSTPLGSIEDVVNSAFFNGYQDATAAGDAIETSIFYNFRDHDTSPGHVSNYFSRLEHNNGYGVGQLSRQGNDTGSLNLNPAFKYVTRLEPDNPLLTAGPDNSPIGADLSYMHGKGGTTYGEPGYDQDTSVPMWPFPGERIMREKMAAYSYDNGNLTGNRGFCLPGQSLSNYVWGYLGNTVPPLQVQANQLAETVVVSWAPPVVRPTGLEYRIYQLNGSSRQLLATVAAPALSQRLSGLALDQPLTLAVTAFDPARGESGYVYPVQVGSSPMAAPVINTIYTR